MRRRFVSMVMSVPQHGQVTSSSDFSCAIWFARTCEGPASVVATMITKNACGASALVFRLSPLTTMSGSSVRFRVATYNIHRCRGLDRRVRPDRVASVLQAIGADVVALQEVVGAGPTGQGQAEALGAALGVGWVMAPTRQYRRHLFGN